MFSLMKAIQTITRPTSSAYRSSDFPMNHEKALEYLELRKKCVATINKEKHLKWVEGDLVSAAEKAQVYSAGTVFCYKTGPNWGCFLWNDAARAGNGVAAIDFRTYECFLAWLLAKFW